jgi:hypothetical protein
MISRPETELKPSDRSDAPQRKPWHAPQFIAMDLASTDTVSNGGTDGGPLHSAS